MEERLFECLYHFPDFSIYVDLYVDSIYVRLIPHEFIPKQGKKKKKVMSTDMFIALLFYNSEKLRMF